MLTWYLARSLLFQREWAMSWMDRRRLWVLPLKCKALGSSKSCPPICCSSWRTSCSIGMKRRKWSDFTTTAQWSSESSRLCAVDAVTCVIQVKKIHRHHTEFCVPLNWNCISWSDYNPLTSFIQQQTSRDAGTSPLGDTVFSHMSYKQKLNSMLLYGMKTLHAVTLWVQK